jgi:hypothetical protein
VFLDEIHRFDDAVGFPLVLFIFLTMELNGGGWTTHDLHFLVIAKVFFVSSPDPARTNPSIFFEQLP